MIRIRIVEWRRCCGEWPAGEHFGHSRECAAAHGMIDAEGLAAQGAKPYRGTVRQYASAIIPCPVLARSDDPKLGFYAAHAYAADMGIQDDQWMGDPKAREEHSTPIILRAERLEP